MRARQDILRRRAQRAGFTLVEMMASVAIFGIMLAIAIPPIYESMDRSDARSYAESVGSRLRLARSQALLNHCDVVVYFNRDGAGSYTVHVDNGGGSGIPGDANFDPANKDNGDIDANEIVQTPIELGERLVFGYVPGGMNSQGDFITRAISYAGNPSRLTFHADGTSSENGWICVMPLSDFLDQTAGRDFLVESTASTGEIRVARTVY